MTCHDCGKSGVHTCSPQVKYDTDLGQFLRTFNIRYVHDNKMFELPIVATCWAEAEAMLKSVKATGLVHSELVEVIE